MSTPNILPVLPLNLTGQDLAPVDASTVSSISLESAFDTSTDIIEAYLYDSNDNFISRITTKYSVTSGIVSDTLVSQLVIDPATDLTGNGYTQGKYKINYNFLRNIIQGGPLFNITQISSDRTELRIQNTSYTDAQNQALVTTLQSILNTGELFKGFYLDFGSDTILLVVNVEYIQGSIVLKLYEALPFNLVVKSNFSFIEKISEPQAYSLEFPQEEIIITNSETLRGPNLNINIQNKVNNSTDFQSAGTLLNASTAALTNQLQSILVEKRAELNTDYSNYSNFVFFSSAEQRLANFYYKASQIQNYNNQIAILNTVPLTTEVSSSIVTYQRQISSIITNFDGYDYHLYFESSSTTWPKSNSTQPYILYSTGSAQVTTWYNNQADSASLYDEFNQNYIYNIYPNYIVEDPDNDQFKLFNDEVAQMFDQIWLYTKALENRQDGDNSLGGGISVDLVADALRSYGVELYESNFTNSDLYTSFLGITPGGSTLPPTGSELITNYVTASAEMTPYNDAQKLIYKRLYHNLPYLLKKKGTVAGLRVLLNCFGISDTIIRINEFGGKDENSSTWDNWQNEFSYAFDTSGSNFVTSSFVLNSSWGATNNRPQAVEFRFKTTGIPASNRYTQSLWSTDTGTALVLKYTGSANLSGSYSGSVVNKYNKYGVLEFYPDTADLTTTASIFLPFFDGGWWSILINNQGSNVFTVYAKDKIYEGVDGNTLGFQASGSVTKANNWATAATSYFASSSFPASIFSGSLQELRYYKNALIEDAFNAYVMNPSSIEGNSLNSGSTELAFRATLGGELYTASISVHPKAAGGWITTSSFASNSNFYFKTTPTFVTNTEIVYYDQVPAGIQNPISDKIKIGRIILPPSGSTNIPAETVLSPFRSIQQKTTAQETVTRDVNYVEIALSPQNEINEDINSSLGFFNIGEYIGDPRFISSDIPYYVDLDTFSKNYFLKYTGNYNWNDYNRLAKYFDNAVFRMIKDFIPARAGVSAGLVIKQHLLERNRLRPAQASYTQPEYTASVTSAARDYQPGAIEVFTGGAGGSVNTLINTSQSWSSSLNTKAGIVNQINSSEYEFYNGEYSGSTIDVIRGKLQDNPLLGIQYQASIGDLQDFTVKASSQIISASTPFLGGGFGSGTIKFDTLTKASSYYNTGTYSYSPGFYNLVDINISVSGSTINSSGTDVLTIYLDKDGTTLAFTQWSIGIGSQFNPKLTISSLPLESGSYSVKYIYNGGNTNVSSSLNILSSWTLSTTNTFAQSTYYLDPTIFTQQNFPGNINEYSDYNSLLNNVYSNRVSNKYYDVDYSNDLTNPVNFKSIISQSALYAQVQDSNYILGSAWGKARYSGTKLTSATYNKFTTGDISYGQKAVIDNYSDYFAVFSNNASAYPEYPEGSNFKLIAILDTTGQIYSLTGDNQYLGFVSNIFKKGTSAIAYAKDVSNQNTATNLTIIEGGAVYNTILYKSGSNSSNEGFIANYSSSQPAYTASLALVSGPSLRDTGTANIGWIYSLNNNTSSLGALDPIRSYGIPLGSNVGIYNKRTGQYITASPYPFVDGALSSSISQQDTYFPLQPNDFVRFGYEPDSPYGVDGAFNTGTLTQIKSITTGSDYNQTSILGILNLNSIPVTARQNYRIFRRVPDETSVVVSTNPQINITSGEVGILIPENFNPNYDPISIAKAAGLIS
jgi:hypothetical protein